MATYAAPIPEITAHRAEREARGWTSWITTTDHKRIGIMYMVTTFVFFLLGGIEALIIRLQLGAPNNTLVTPTVYNQLFTMHGTTMIFLFVVPVMAGFGNYFVPLMIGARDMAFPKMNAFGFWLLDQYGVLCDPEAWFQGHGLWHLLTAIAAYLLVVHYAHTPHPDAARAPREFTPSG